MTGPQYEKKVRASLQGNLERLEIQKLRLGQALTPQDMAELEKMLVNLGGNEGSALLSQLLERTEAPSLLHFILNCVGMERKAVQERFSEFLSERNSTQTRFDSSNSSSTNLWRPERSLPRPFINSPSFRSTLVVQRHFSQTTRFCPAYFEQIDNLSQLAIG